MRKLLNAMTVLLITLILAGCPPAVCPSRPQCLKPPVPVLAKGGENLPENFGKVVSYSKDLEAEVQCYEATYK